MKLTNHEFGNKRDQGELIIALIGMSGMGKSYRSAQLRDLGFSTYCCDDEIAKRISSLLPSEDVGGLAAWMGQPYVEGYKDRERQYLELEEEVTRDALEAGLQHNSPEARLQGADANAGSLASGSGLEARLPNACNRVIDTTGSVIYLADKLLKKLKEEALIVYLEGSQAMRDKMFEVFLRDPKPIVWGDSFSREPGESNRDALARCYPELLAYRASRYAALADVTLPYRTARDERSTGEQFLENITNFLL